MGLHHEGLVKDATNIDSENHGYEIHHKSFVKSQCRHKISAEVLFVCDSVAILLS